MTPAGKQTEPQDSTQGALGGPQDRAPRREPRDGYAQGLLDVGSRHEEVFVLDADCSKANYTSRFQEAFPDRFLNIGIAECDIVGTAAGLSLLGKVPFVNAYANFLTGRGFDQIRVSVAYSGRNVKVVGHNAGTTAAQEGATHLPLEDVSLMRSLPEMTVVCPCDAVETRKAVAAAYELDGPVYLRVAKLAVDVVTREDTPFDIGRALRLREGSDVTLVSTGCMLSEVLGAARRLHAQGVEAEVLHVHTVKPLDAQTLLESVGRTGCVVTAEEHSVIGGLGSAVAELLVENRPVPMERVGTRDVFGLSGTMDELFDYFGLRAGDIAQAALRAVGRRSG
ncbi:transketolase family protein [Actinomyces wuliandei]|uniref:transketolase family protein n=1 Tax=Actinomyces wuliandei TaxID=2057743 RepID=UPI000FD7E7A5|nr:transketolase C-terminal domain-containing protein [Actinomyces wuliandei]